MANLAYAIERLRRRQRVRYWALALPMIVIALALPLLRPLRQPDPRTISDDEWVRLETIRQLATRGTFELDPDRVKGRRTLLYLTPPPPTSRPTTRSSATSPSDTQAQGETSAKGAGQTGAVAPPPSSFLSPPAVPPATSPATSSAASPAGLPAAKGTFESPGLGTGSAPSAGPGPGSPGSNLRTSPPVPGPRVRVLAAQEPMLAVLAAGVYLLLRLAHVGMGPETVLGPYLLTLILSTLPVAFTATLLYRCARLLELSRPKRMTLAMLALTAGGLLPYATVISPYPLSALCVTAALTCVAHVATMRPWPQGAGWMFFGGLLAGLSAAVHPSSAVMGVCLALVPMAMPWRSRTNRVLAVIVFAIGIAPPVALHRVLMENLGGGWTASVSPAAANSVLAGTAGEQTGSPAGEKGAGGRTGGDIQATGATSVGGKSATAPGTSVEPQPGAENTQREEEDTRPAGQSNQEQAPGRLAAILHELAGNNGLISNAPAILVALCGMALVLVRHWPKTTRAIALACLGGLVGPLLIVWLGADVQSTGRAGDVRAAVEPSARERGNPGGSASGSDMVISLGEPVASSSGWSGPRGVAERAYGPQGVVTVVPMVLMWAGVLLRQGWGGSRVTSLAVVGWGVVIVSCGVGLLGLLGPMPRGGFSGYPPWDLIKRYSPFIERREVAFVPPVLNNLDRKRVEVTMKVKITVTKTPEGGAAKGRLA